MNSIRKAQGRQVVFIGGGEAFDTREAYLDFLESADVENPFEPDGAKRWKHTLPDELGEEYVVAYLVMPCPKNAKYDEWKLWFNKYIPFFEDGVIFIGHSLGANFLVKYLGESCLPVKIEQLHLVAGCFGARGGFSLPEDLSGVPAKVENICIYHSKDDEVVSFEHAQKYKKALKGSKFKSFNDRGHFLQEEFPELVKNIRNNA